MKQIFTPFPRLPKELRLKVWHLARPGPCIVRQIWNKSVRDWQFARNVPPVLHACSESRTEFVRGVDDLDSNPLIYRWFKDMRPFCFCYELDTLYVRRDFNSLNLQLLGERLRFLQMDWGFELYWWSGSQQGPSLLRLFPCLQILTLVVQLVAPQQIQELLEVAKVHVETMLEIEQKLYPKWVMPEIRYTWGEVDWILALNLLPENERFAAIMN